MKKLRPFIPIMAVGAVLLILLGFVGFRLFQALRIRGAAVAQVDTLKRDLRRLQNADPFPSRGNIDQMFSNAARAGSNLTNLLQEITANSFVPPATEPAGFNRLLGEYINRWYGVAVSNNVFVAQEMGYGFEQYVAGQLPRAEHIPNLMKQLLMTDHLVRILARAHVSQIESIRRLQFEGAEGESRGPAAGGFPGMMGMMGFPGAMMGMMSGARRGGEMAGEGLAGPLERKDDAIYMEFPFEVAFISNAEALRAILNEAARSPRMMVVTSVTVENLKAGDASGAAGGGFPGMGGFPGGARSPGMPGAGEFGRFGQPPGGVSPGVPGTAVPYFREQRIVMGGQAEAIRAVLRLNFIQFDPLDAAPSSAEPPSPARRDEDAVEAAESAPVDAAGMDLPAEAAFGDTAVADAMPEAAPDLEAGGAP